ncbi:MAG TPA: oxygenase MpaB family protein [Terracidiphilus sp.]|jgi:uncharacterized protein (DUF2236 family)
METSANRGEMQYVSRSDIDTIIGYLAHSVADRRAGLFGPDSMSWRINRESALFLGAGRAALLQLAHPWVATAIGQHSSVMARPIARFHNTFRIVFTMIFGSLQQVAAASRSLHTLHTRIQGKMAEDVARYPRGSHYQANEIAALRWVYATLIETAVLAYETVQPPLAPQELNAYYAETKTFASLFGIPASELPRDWQSFLIYCREMEQSHALGVSDAARAMGHGILAGAGSWIKPPQWYRALTAAWLPPRLRAEFELPFGVAEERAVAKARLRLPRWYRRLPSNVRYVGPWHEAQARLAGRAPDLIARAGNRFWIGQARMPFAN